MLFREEDIPFFSKEVVNLCLFFTHVERVFFGTPYFAATSLFVIPFSKSFKALHFTPIGLLFNLRFMGTIFLSQRTKNGLFEFTTLYAFKNQMHDSKTFEWSNSMEKVRILLKKLGEVRKSSSYRGKFIQGTDKFVQPTEMFEFSSIRVIDIFCLKRVREFWGPTNLFDLTRCSSFRVFELSRVNCTVLTSEKNNPSLSIDVKIPSLLPSILG